MLLGEFGFDDENRLLFEDICRVYWLIEKYVVAKMDPKEVVKRDLERIKVLKYEGYGKAYRDLSSDFECKEEYRKQILQKVCKLTSLTP